LDPASWEALFELAGDEPEFLRTLIGTFQKESRPLLEGMRRAVVAADAATLEKGAHSLKSAAAQVGALALARICVQLERQARTGSLVDAAELCERAEAELDRVDEALREVAVPPRRATS
jgi:HPt (histidine-containing phosphotransfer) domain-containing protein